LKLPTWPKNRLWLLLLVPFPVLAARGAWVGYSAYRFERQLVFTAHRLGAATPEASGLAGAVDVEYGQSDGQPLRGWYAPSTNGAAIVFVHGAGGDRRSLAREAALLRGDGFGVLLIDLPGQGESGGQITAGRSEEAAILAAVDWLARQDAGGGLRIGGLSFSLGSQFLVRAAAAEPRLRAVVLEAASTSIIDRVRASHRQHPWLGVLPATLAFFQSGTNPWDADGREAVSAIAPRPVLLVGGSEDPMATPTMAQELLARAGPGGRLETFPTGHGGYWEAGPERYPALLRSFFGTAL
jgi:uncharacterized protein